MDDMDPRLLAIAHSYGVFLRHEAVALGYKDDALARLVRDGSLHRVRRGAYVPGEVWRAADRDAQYRLHVKAALRQSRTRVIASHSSAVALHEGPSWGLDLAEAHLTRADGKAGRNEAGIRQHRGVLLPDDVVELGEFEVMSPTRAGLEVTMQTSTEAALCVLDDFLHRELTTDQQLRERYDTMGNWPSTLATDLAIHLADGRSESVGETRTRYLLWLCHLPRPVPQLEVYDEQGRLVGRVDFAWPDHGLFLEFDGLQKYVTYRRPGESVADAVLREKKREELICALTGWRCIRVTWSDLKQPDLLVARIRKLLMAAAPGG